jgi:hypothetical protein
VARKKPARKKEPTPKHGIAWPRWTGFRGKTVWDWLQLLVVPLALAGIGLFFTSTQKYARQLEEARQRAQEAEIQAQHSALQAYFDQMQHLILEEDLPGASAEDYVAAIARARTRTVLAQMDDHRRGRVVQFLYEASLLEKERPIINLSGVRLRGGNLSQLDLSEAYLGGADLSGADLSDVVLVDADLSGAELFGANINFAILRDADLSESYLVGTNLRAADLSGANLRDAILSEADLSSANLRDARGVTDEQLDQAASLEGATMPDGSKHP